jgi:guanine deaminase
MLIRGGRVLRGDLRTCDTADVLVQDGNIVAIERPGVIDPAHHRVIDASQRLLIPGLVNGHTHGHGALAKGLVEDRVPLEVFLSASGAVNASRSVADKRLTATLSAVELIRKGCTACYDLFVEIPAPSREGLEAVADAYREAGIRAVVAPMLADRTLYQALPGLLESLPPTTRDQVTKLATAPADASLAAARDTFARWPFDRDVIVPAIAPRFRFTAAMRSCRAARTSRASSTSACRRISPKARRRRCSRCTGTARASSSTSFASACRDRASARRTRSGSTTRTLRALSRLAQPSCTTR